MIKRWHVWIAVPIVMWEGFVRRAKAATEKQVRLAAGILLVVSLLVTEATR